VVRIYVASRHGPRFWTTVATVVVERALDGLALGLIVAGRLLLVPVPAEMRWSIALFLTLDLVAIVLLALIAIAPGLCRVLIETIFHRVGWLERRLLGLLGTMTEGLRGIRAPRNAIPVVLSSVAIWLLLALSVWTAMHAAHLDLPLVAVELAFDGRFELDQGDADIVVRINGTDLIQILLNLMVNAFQCTSQSHRVELRCKVLSEPLELSGFHDGPHDRLTNREHFQNVPPLLALSISDNGPGIPAGVLPNIFNAYFTTKGPAQGAGLGLNIVLRLVKEAQGAIHVHTKVGEGTTFTLYLPTIRDSGEHAPSI